MVKVKICGINSAAAIDAAVAAGADWVGFVFYPPSPRFVRPAEARDLAARGRDGVARVGLFVAPTDADIATTLEAVPLDILQIYASADRAAALRARFGLPVWRALGIWTAADLPDAADNAEMLLLEAKARPDATNPGGNGQSFDWSLLRGWAAPRPWVLAGGLSPANVADAVRMTGAAAVDVSSGVERTRGIKDPALIAAFVAAARAA